VNLNLLDNGVGRYLGIRYINLLDLSMVRYHRPIDSSPHFWLNRNLYVRSEFSNKGARMSDFQRTPILTPGTNGQNREDRRDSRTERDFTERDFTERISAIII
jgi:hypothetical protein